MFCSVSGVFTGQVHGSDIGKVLTHHQTVLGFDQRQSVVPLTIFIGGKPAWHQILDCCQYDREPAQSKGIHVNLPHLTSSR